MAISGLYSSHGGEGGRGAGAGGAGGTRGGEGGAENPRNFSVFIYSRCSENKILAYFYFGDFRIIQFTWGGGGEGGGGEGGAGGTRGGRVVRRIQEILAFSFILVVLKTKYWRIFILAISGLYSSHRY